MNKLAVEYWEDFQGDDWDMVSLEKDGIMSWKMTPPDETIFEDFVYDIEYAVGPSWTGVFRKKENAMDAVGFAGYFGDTKDYLQFTLENKESKQKTYTVSFMFYFGDIAGDENVTDVSAVEYKLPLKLVSIDESGTETTIKSGVQIPYRCGDSAYDNKEYHEILQTVAVPAGKTIHLQLKLDGSLPTCQDSANHTAEGAADAAHPVKYTVDNICIFSGENNTVTVKKGETYQVQLNTLETDTVEYYTNHQAAQCTHNDTRPNTDCHRYDTLIASVDESGLVTATSPGETSLVAEITHADGNVERKQCIIKVEE